MRDGERRVRERLRAAGERGLLDALCEGVLERLPDGSALFFPWGSLGSGYRVAAGARAALLHRRLRRILAAGLLAPPAAALVAASCGRLAPALALLVAVGALALLAVAALSRGLPRSDARLRAAEARARIAAALGERGLRRAAAVALALGLACLAAEVASGGNALCGAASA